MASVDVPIPTGKPSDIARQITCDPCLHSGSVKEASAYCQQCEENMCGECASTHKGSKLSRNHSICSGSDLVLSEQIGVEKLSLSYCAEHGDKAIDWFCEKDEVMFCDICKLIKHRKCQVTSVSDKTAFGHAQSLADVMNSLVALNRRIAKFKSDRQKSAKDIEDAAYSCELKVHEFKSTIMETVENLAKQLLDNIKNVVTTEAVIIQDHVHTCDSLIPQVEDALTTADKAKAFPDDVTSVIAAHKLAKALKTLETTISDLEQEVYHVQIKFQPSGKLTEVFSETDQLGMLEIDRAKTVVPPETVYPGSVHTSWSDMEVVSWTEIKVPSNVVTGSTVMPDGRLILADYSNKQIILLHQDFSIQSTLTLPGRPWDVALYGGNAAVVTVPSTRQLQHILVDTILRTGHTIPIVLGSRGVAVHCGLIYVTVFLGLGDHGDHVQVLDTGGNVTRRIGVDFHGIVSRSIYLDYITVSTGGTVYISDYTSGHIRCYTNAGDVVYGVKHEGVSDPRGMLVDEKGNLLVCCYESNTIHVLGKYGAHHKVILSSADGLVCPLSVSYRRSDQTLIVTMANTQSCRAYKLK